MCDKFRITNRTRVGARSCSRAMPRLIRIVKYFIFATSFFIWEMDEVRSQILDTETVTIKQGVLRGGSKLLNGHRIFTFLGVPYAEAPVGSRRLRPTSPHPGWTSTYTATDFKPVCPQPTGNVKVRNSMSEDCLYLNIWTTFLPKNFEQGRRRPVVILIEGQLFTLGNPEDVQAEDFVADQDVVFVSMNYRLNALGFLSWEDEILPGNLGLLDQYLAILWVYENIDAFGGDRNQITLFGHSAGAASVVYHLISPRTNLFIQRAVMMSGSALAPWASQPNPRDNARALARSLGCLTDDSRSVLKCLQEKQMIDIITSVDQMIRGGNVSAFFSPVANENFLTEGSRFFNEDPESAMKSGNFKRVPMMCGLVTDEGMLLGYLLKEHLDRLSVADIGNFMENTVLEGVLKQLPSLRSSQFVKSVLMHEYFRSDEGEPEPTIFPVGPFEDRSRRYDEVIRFFTDAYFLAPLEKQMRLMSAAGGTVYFYTNDFRSKDIFGNRLLNRTSAAHGSDLLYLFGPEMYRKFFNQGFQTFSEERMSRNMKAIFGDFVAMGTPTTNLEWRPYTSETNIFYELENGITGRRYRSEKAYTFWHNYLPKLADQLQGATPPVPVGSNECTVYAAFTWVFLVALLILFLILLAMFFLMRKRTSGKVPAPQSVFSVSGRSYGADSSFQAQSFPPRQMTAPTVSSIPVSSPAQSSHSPPFPKDFQKEFPDRRRSSKHHWRETVTDYRL